MDALTREPADLVTRRRPRVWLTALLCLLVAAGLIYVIWFWPASKPAKTARDRDANQKIPVVVTTAGRRDVPIYQDGLGTVQAYYTVTVHTMVDGPLLTVNFKEGQAVHKGDVLAQIDPRTYQAALELAEAKKAQDEAQLANARVDLARYQKLVANNYTSSQQADTQKATVAQLEAQTRQDQAQIDTARTQLSFTTIVSPIDGLSGIRQVDAGNIVHATDTTGLVVLTQLQPISVVFTLPQQSLPSVAAAMRHGTPTVLAYAQGPNGAAARLLDTGSLAVLDNQVDQTTGTIKLKATFPNRDSLLWPGGFVGVRLQVDTARQAVIVPPAAVQRGPRGAYVFMVEQGDTTKRQPVTVGYEDANESLISSGLKGDERVVVEGASRLSDGTKVTIAPPTEAPSANPVSAPGTQAGRSG
jgi:multidrug efflux system membrane fusion protein